MRLVIPPICEPGAVTLLAAKILLAPLCVLAVSLAGRRWGIAVAGVLGGLPIVAGPILLVETLLHGRDFGADAAAAGTLLGLAALTAFVVVYGRRATSAGPIVCVLCGWSAFLVAVALLYPVRPPAALSLALVAAGFALGLRLLPASSTPLAPLAPPWWDLPARGLAALGLVLVLTAVSGALGPHLSGLLAPFPIITSVLAVFTHAHGGAAQVDLLLRNFLVGFNGFAAFCFVLAVALPALATGAAFGLATAVALAVQATILLLRRSSYRRASRPVSAL